MNLERSDKLKAKAFKRRDDAEEVAATLQARLPRWTVAVVASPDKPDCFSVRAERVFSDINENGVEGPLDGRNPIELVNADIEPSLACTGRIKVLWLKENGVLYLPKEDEE